MYKKSFYLTENLGNNVFSYEKRTHTSLYIPSCIDGTFLDLIQGTETVFEDFDEKNILQSCRGLRNFVRMEWKRIPMIVCDNHNHALYFWYEARERGAIAMKNTLVHIDEHSDLWENKNDLPSGEPRLEEIYYFTNHQCNVGNYIQPALREGLIEKVLRIEDTIGMERYISYKKGEQETVILNLDLDFFAPELSYIPFEDKKRTILYFASQASLITVATSPFFIDQDRAIAMLGKVFGFMET